ncbi:MAG: hypothetical protein AAGF30_05320 [Pseudomonadota bacterium]
MKYLAGSLTALLIATPLLANIPEGVNTRIMLGLEGPASAKGISNSAVAELSLAAQGIDSLVNRNLRTRFWTMEPGGYVPIHDHTNRPAQVVVLTGGVVEFSSATDERIEHRTNGLSLEEGAIAHWWLNEGSETVHLIAFDVYEVNDAPAEAAPVPSPVSLSLPDASGADLNLLGVVDIGNHFGDGTGAGLVLSSYQAEIAPGGVLPDFTGAAEPLQTFVWKGTVTEHRADGAAVLETLGGSDLSLGQTAWWENTGDVPAVLYFTTVEPATEVDGVPRTGQLAHGSHGD